MKFKVGDKIKAIDNYYDITSKENEWEGEVVEVFKEYFNTKTTKCKILGMIGEKFERLKCSHFELILPFTKNDLQNGDIVTLRNGDKLVYSNEKFMDMSDENDNQLEDLSNLDEEMNYAFYCSENMNRNNDILKVERSREYETVFERNEKIKKMTLKEIEKELGYKIEIISEVDNERNKI